LRKTNRNRLLTLRPLFKIKWAIKQNSWKSFKRPLCQFTQL